MATVLAFDVYGTLIDTAGVTRHLEVFLGDKADEFSTKWREKQLEYSFRRGLMKSYNTFAGCTLDAFNYCTELYNLSLTPLQRDAVLQSYQSLPAFDDVELTLQSLARDECSLYAFSNGTSEAVDIVLKNAGLRNYFLDIISVDEVKSFKPDPEVYRHLLKRTDASPESCWLISSNAFDVIGALHCGLHSVWIRRNSNAVFDHFGVSPTKTLSSLAELPSIL